MNMSLRVGAATIGMFLIAVFLRSVLQVAVINRRSGDWLAHYIGLLVRTTLARRALKRQSYAGIQDVLAWGLPLYILLLIVAWFSLVQAGFSLLIWSSQAGRGLLQAVIASGSALSTLGFRTPTDKAGQQLAILEGPINVSKLHRLEFRPPVTGLAACMVGDRATTRLHGRSAGSYYLNRIPRHVSRIPEGEISLPKGESSASYD